MNELRTKQRILLINGDKVDILFTISYKQSKQESSGHKG